MSARDLVGRPLVPFFDADDNVNEALQFDAEAHEQLDVDARVWDKDLGYFVYPADSASSHSLPIPIKKETPTASTNDGLSGSFGKMLLTPDMLSRSAPSASGSNMQQLHNTMGMTHPVDHHATPVNEDTTRVEASRSGSTKRGTRQKNRSATPTRNNNARTKQRNSNAPQQPQTSDGTSSGGEDRTASDSSDKAKGKKTRKEPSKKNRTKNQSPTQNQSQTQNQIPQKSKDDLSSNGKWAWSAFQSSPDPKSLPLPPFMGGGGSSVGLGALPPPLDPPKVEERLDPPPPGMVVAGRPPPPEGAMMHATPVPLGLPPHPTSVEHSMTQDLRRMLNIGS